MNRKLNLDIQTGDDVVVLEDPFNPDETYTRPRVQLVDVDVIHMVAEFPRVQDARAFDDRYLHSGRSSEANVRFDGSRRLRWDAAVAHDPPVSSVRAYVQDLLENVECVGGTRGRLGFSRTDVEPSATVAPRPLY